MKTKILILCALLAVFTTGCAGTARVRRPHAVSEAPLEEISRPNASFTVGERFTYLGAWKGIPIGRATVTVEELMAYKDYEVYKIVVIAKTNKFLSKIYKVEDTFISYIDKDKLISRRYEAVRREGRYKKDVVVEYDFKKYIATYNNLLDGTIKNCPIEENVQDPVSAVYFFRTIPADVGDEIKISLNLNEENYEVVGNIEKTARVDLPELGSFDAFLIKPYIKFEGKRQRRASAWGYLSTDEKRLGLYMAIKVLEIPWIGNITITLEKMEYLKIK